MRRTLNIGFLARCAPGSQAAAIKGTLSVGAALLQESDRAANDLIKRADERLYQAKNSGRNRVCA